MRDATPQTIHLGDYTPPAFLISTVALDVDIREAQATVRATLRLARNPAHGNDAAPLVLDGHDMELLSAAIDGRALAADEYRASTSALRARSRTSSSALLTSCRFSLASGS